MAVVFNRDLSGDERAWGYRAGATRQNLLLINKAGREFKANEPVDVRLGHLDKGKHSFLFVNEGESKRNLGVLIVTGYHFEVAKGAVWYSRSSATREEGIIGIFEAGAIGAGLIDVDIEGVE